MKDLHVKLHLQIVATESYGHWNGVDMDCLWLDGVEDAVSYLDATVAVGVFVIVERRLTS